MKDCAEEERLPEADTSKQNSWINLVRGKRFYINLQKLMESKQSLNNLKALNQRNCDLNIDTISYRTLHHWDSMNLIECERKTASSWRKFNLFEVLWVHVILKFREMGVSLDMISKAKEGFFEHIYSSDIKYADYYTIAALYFKAPVYFIALPCGQSEFLEYSELTNAMAITVLNDCIFIHLNPLLNQIFQNIEVKSSFPLMKLVTLEQHQICDLIDHEEFDSIKIVKSKGKITQANIEKGFSPKTSYSEISEDRIDAVITTKISKGAVTSRSRTKKVNIVTHED